MDRKLEKILETAIQALSGQEVTMKHMTNPLKPILILWVLFLVLMILVVMRIALSWQ